MRNRLGIDVGPDGCRVAEDTGDGVRDYDVAPGVAADPAAVASQIRDVIARWTSERGRSLDEVVVVTGDQFGDRLASLAAELGLDVRTVSAETARARSDAPESVYALARGALLASESRAVAAAAPSALTDPDAPEPAPSQMRDFGEGARMDDFGDAKDMSAFGGGRDMAAFGTGASMGDFGAGDGDSDRDSDGGKRRPRRALVVAAVILAVLLIGGTALALSGGSGKGDDDRVSTASETTVRATTTTLSPANARLEGAWVVEIVTVESEGSAAQAHGFTVGRTVVRRFDITPNCASGPCDLTIVRESASGTQTNTFTFADGVYRFREGESAFCVDSETGEPRPDLPQTVFADFTLRVTAVDASGRPTAFEFEIVTVFDAQIEQDECTDGRDRQVGQGRPA